MHMPKIVSGELLTLNLAIRVGLSSTGACLFEFQFACPLIARDWFGYLTKRLGNHIVLFGIDSIWGNPHWAFLDADYELVCQLADSKKFSKPDWKLDALQVSYAIYVVLECIFHPFDADSMADGPIERPPVFAFVFMAKQTHNSRPWLAEW